MIDNSMKNDPYTYFRAYPLTDCQRDLINFYSKISPVLKENNIVHWAHFGTLIGAIRHGGFIPWDDDLDFGIDIDNFLRLKTLVKEQGWQHELKPCLSIITDKGNRIDFFPYHYYYRELAPYDTELHLKLQALRQDITYSKETYQPEGMTFEQSLDITKTLLDGNEPTGPGMFMSIDYNWHRCTSKFLNKDMIETISYKYFNGIQMPVPAKPLEILEGLYRSPIMTIQPKDERRERQQQEFERRQHESI